MSFLRLIRWPNLIIVALTLYFFRYISLVPFFSEWNIDFILNDFEFALLVWSTVCVTSCGNIINDIYDLSLDQANQSTRPLARGQLSIKFAHMTYGVFLLLGVVPYLILPTRWIFTYATFQGVLWLYSFRGKRHYVTKNAMIAALCAAVPGMVWFTEERALLALKTVHEAGYFQLISTFVFYIFFAFVTTMIRELIKDLEDEKGDAESGILTFVIAFGKQKAMRAVQVLTGLFVVGVLVFALYFMTMLDQAIGAALVCLVLIVPAVLFAGLLLMAKFNTNYTRLSSYLKLYMLVGLLTLPALSFI